jgi:hypothetical protein
LDGAGWKIAHKEGHLPHENMLNCMAELNIPMKKELECCDVIKKRSIAAQRSINVGLQPP